jgi:hypothetical protein
MLQLLLCAVLEQQHATTHVNEKPFCRTMLTAAAAAVAAAAARLSLRLAEQQAPCQGCSWQHRTTCTAADGERQKFTAHSQNVHQNF